MSAKSILSVEEPASAARSSQPVLSRRILVVDDEPLIRRINAGVLLHAGYQVDVAENGQVAWEMMQFNSYDLLVTDQEMPEMTGVDLLKKLHASCMTLPVIMATATFPKDDFIRCPWLRPTATLLKPYAISELVGTVEKVLHGAEIAAGFELSLNRDAEANDLMPAGEVADISW